ncbi:ATP-binding protein [Pelagicoccus albus]|uniref:histidine kinase n=1 Tax=Pelagicoccus albus TaxID=415222 RepID=A0A7X1B3G0_9BACT|nr:ATP-binding protein [Pelagicoccus albus]MBC2604943.1 response regulator [Pelagicoccus albus]
MPNSSGFREDEWSRFVEYNISTRVANSRIGTLLIVLLMPFGALLDYFVYPESFWFFLLLRVGCSLIALLCWWVLKGPIGRKFYRAFGLFIFALPSVFIALMIYYTEGVASPYYAGLNLILIGLTWVAQMYVPETVLAVLMMICIYTAACYYHGGTGLSRLINNYYFIGLTGLIGITGSYYLNRSRFREFLLREQMAKQREELKESNLKLLEMDKAKTNFFANISHELRTPLTLLIGPLDRLRRSDEGVADTERKELLDIMQQNAMRLMRLINDLLNLVRLDSGSLKLRPTTVELEPYLEGICRSFFPLAEERGLDFRWEIDDGGIAMVNLDREKVEKVLLNLLFNAIKFTPEKGAITVRAKRLGKHVRIEIEDTGKGIAPEELESVFDRFWQAETSSNRRYQGVGIGLALVRDLVRLHGGEVDAKSELGKGTVMGATLDVTVEPIGESSVVSQGKDEVDTKWLETLYRRADFFPTQLDVNSTVEKPSGEVATEEEELPGILVADDEPEMMRFLRSQLKGAYRIHEAHNGMEALKLAESHRFHLILLDYMMPEMDGIAATKRLREMPQHKGVPIIMLTARADEEVKFEALDAGATDFLTKPFSSMELLARCRNLAAVYDMQQQIEDRTKRLEKALSLIKQTETQMVQQAKMASLGQLSAGLLHEVNNPLNFAVTSIHLIKKRLSRSPHPEPELLEKPLADMHEGIRRVSSIVSSLREFTHPDASRFERIDLLETIDTAIRFVQIPVAKLSLEKEVSSGLLIRGNQTQLVHLFINLLQNSVDSLLEKGGEGRWLKISGVEEGDEIKLVFEDNGLGIKRQELGQVFDAFFTTKKVGKGVGLGLSICHRIIDQHNGKILVDSEYEDWCRFTITLPRYANT